MNIPLNTKDIIHICALLREDIQCGNEVIAERVHADEEALQSIKRSQGILLKVAKSAILNSYDDDDTTPMETRPGLN
tara:strand:+ start:3196 stop:3426 length:231 start_codon:yes stop_codon:yes gene_type:complete